MNDQTAQRFRVTGQAGGSTRARWAVVDTHDRQGGTGMRRVGFFRTFQAAQAEARRRNRA